MTILDIILILTLIYAAYRGFKDGAIIQLGGIIAILIGIWLAFKYSGKIAALLHFDFPFGDEAAFLITIVAVILFMWLVGWILTKIVDMAGMGPFNKITGLVLSVLKIALITGAILIPLERMNGEKHWVEQQTIERSYVYRQVRGFCYYMFPYFKTAKDTLIDKIDDNRP